MIGIRVAEVMAALSLTTDLATGMPFEKGLRVCLVADELVRHLDGDESLRLTAFQTTLLRSIGCTSRAPENAAEFHDDVAFQRAAKQLDPGDPVVLGQQLAKFGDWTGTPGSLAGRLVEIFLTMGRHAASTGCEVSRALAPALGTCPGAVSALDDVYERWDGQGIPEGRSADQLSLAGRILHVAEQAVLAQIAGGTERAVGEVLRRRGGHLDPDVAGVFLAHAPAILEAACQTDLLAAVLDREPAPHPTVQGPM